MASSKRDQSKLWPPWPFYCSNRWLLTHLLRAPFSPLFPSHPITSAMHWIRSINIKTIDLLASFSEWYWSFWDAPRNQTREEVYCCPWMLCYQALCPCFRRFQDLCTLCSLLSRCVTFSSSGEAGFLPSASPTPASHQLQPKHRVRGQKPQAAGWRTSVHLGSNQLTMDYVKQLHPCRGFHSLHLKTDFSELYRDQSQEGTPPNCLSLELHSTPWEV